MPGRSFGFMITLTHPAGCCQPLNIQVNYKPRQLPTSASSVNCTTISPKSRSLGLLWLISASWSTNAMHRLTWSFWQWRIYGSEERIAFIIRVTRIGELGTTSAVTSNRNTLRRSTCHPHDGNDAFLRYVSSYKRRGVTHQKTAFFTVSAVKTSNLT
jgi:hypothetical protein